MESVGKNLILIGFILLIVGVIFTLSGKYPMLGNLPGDISIKRDNFQFFFPLTTSILISILLSLILWFFNR